LLREHKFQYVYIETLLGAVRNEGPDCKEILEILLEACSSAREHNGSVKKLLVAAIWRHVDDSGTIIDFLLNRFSMDLRSDSQRLFEEIMVGEARQIVDMQATTMHFLLERFQNLLIPEKVLEMGLSSGDCSDSGVEVLSLLLERCKESVITEAVVQRICAHHQGEKLFSCVLDRAIYIKTSAEILNSIARNKVCGAQILRLLWYTQKHTSVKLVRDILEVLVKTNDPNPAVAEMVLEKPECYNSENALKALKVTLGQKWKCMRITKLIDHCDGFMVTEELLRIAAGNRYSGTKALPFLLRLGMSLEIHMYFRCVADKTSTWKKQDGTAHSRGVENCRTKYKNQTGHGNDYG
jgi:hypothetical protein